MNLVFLTGMAQAALTCLLGLAALGKTAGCMRGSRSMCRKAGFDVMLIVLVAGAAGASGSLLGSLAIVVIAAAGWLYTRSRGDVGCACFGVLSGLLNRRMQFVRAVMLAAATWGAISPAHRDASFWAGAALTHCLVVCWLAAEVAGLSSQRVSPDDAPPSQLEIGTRIEIEKLFAERAGNSLTVSVSSLQIPGKPLGLLFLSSHCGTCADLKRQLLPVMSSLHFPMWLVDELPEGPYDEDSPILIDSSGTLQAGFQLWARPSLLVLDSESRLRGMASGSSEIYSLLLTMSTNSLSVQTGATDRQPGRPAIEERHEMSS